MKNRRFFDIIIKNIRENSGNTTAYILLLIKKDVLSNGIKGITKKNWKEVEDFVQNHKQN